MAGDPRDGNLEDELRRRLAGVELVCQAELADELLDRAEDACRRAFRVGTADRLATWAPATLVTYVAVRGAERYEGIAIWPQLGVEAQSQRVGRAFLSALRRLGLPDFHDMVEQENARTYVAPILIHGGLAADHAPGLVARLEAELERGLVDGEEAVERIAADRGHLGRPVQRLVRYAPEFAAELFDALIDHITGAAPSAGSQAISRHLRDALDADRHRGRRGLRRVLLPSVAFDPWAGFGPEAICAESGPTWVLHQDGRTMDLRPGDSVALDPSAQLVVQGQGRRRALWRHPVLWFGTDGRVVPPDARLPAIATALVPPGWQLRLADRGPPEMSEDHLPLSGPWSRHVASTFDLTGATEVLGEPPAGSRQPLGRWPVSSTREPVLAGATVDAASTADGGPVFGASPTLQVVTGDRPVALWFTPLDGPTRHRLFEPTEIPPTGLPLGGWLGPGPLVGTIEARAGDGRRRSFPFAVAPGLSVTGLDRPLSPSETASVRIELDPGSFGISSLDVPVPQLVDEVSLSLPGLPDGGLRLDVPRVRWALRRRAPGRLELAANLIRADVDTLLEAEAMLLVRCGRGARVQLTLWVEGQQAQLGRSQPTRATGGRHHQCAFPLAPYRDTLRRHRRAAIELCLNVDGVSMPGVRCNATASTTTHRASTPPASVSGARLGSSSDGWIDTEEDERASSWKLHKQLHRLRPADQVVTFVFELGEATRHWHGRPAGPDDLARGPGGTEWEAFAEVGDRLWRIQSRRYHLYAGRCLDDEVMSWARRTANTVRRLARAEREVAELWSMQRLPPLERMSRWRQAQWVQACVPSKARGRSGVDWLPAALLFQVLVLAGGDSRSGPAVASAVEVVPEPVSELVAFLLEAARTGKWPQPFVPAADEPTADVDDTGTALEAPSAGTATPGRKPLTSLDRASVRIDGRRLIVQPVIPVAPPVLRLSTPEGHARALLFPATDGGDLVFPLPPDLAGPHELKIVNTRAAPVAPYRGIPVELPSNGHAPPPPVEAQARGLDQIPALRRHVLVRAVARSVESQRVTEAPIDDLFDDEHGAATSLSTYARTCGDGDVANRLGLAALSMAMLYPGLLSRTTDARELQGIAPVVWAILAPRDAALWRPLGWPNSAGFAAGTERYDDVVAFARSRYQSIGVDGRRPSTVRYELPRAIVVDRRVPRTVVALERHGLDRTFVDVVVATYVALSIDAVSPEATRLLVAAHHAGLGTTTEAVLVGIALYLASMGH